MTRSHIMLIAVLGLAQFACLDDPQLNDLVLIDQGTDSATPDSATPDSATPDSATPDSATPDSATPDSATPDSRIEDQGSVPDSLQPDTAPHDATLVEPDAQLPDARIGPCGEDELPTPRLEINGIGSQEITGTVTVFDEANTQPAEYVCPSDWLDQAGVLQTQRAKLVWQPKHRGLVPREPKLTRPQVRYNQHA